MTPTEGMNMEWIKINHEDDNVPLCPFLLSDEYVNVYVGVTAFDYYDAVYWFPMPKYPMGDAIITNDEWVTKAAKSGMLK